MLIKHSEFEEENECRIAYTTDIANEKLIRLPEKFNDIGSIYINYANISSYIDKIILGVNSSIKHMS